MTTPSELSLFHKILILAEDKGTINLEDLSQFGGSRQALGALGRLEGLKLIERTKNGKDSDISLTDKGNQFLDDILAYLPDAQRGWDGTWYMILFDIPESNRSVRQMFRLKLLELGARLLQSSVWVTTNEHTAERFRAIAGETNFGSAVHIFEAKEDNETPIDTQKLWNLTELEQDYKQLFTYFTQAEKQLRKSKNASFDAKCLIVHLALTCRKDPNLPSDRMPKNWIGYEAPKWYTKLRTYCQ